MNAILEATEKKQRALFITENMKDDLMQMKEDLESRLGQRLTHEQFVGLLVSNSDWINYHIEHAFKGTMEF